MGAKLLSLLLFLFFVPVVFAAPQILITSIPSSATADAEFSISISLSGLDPNTAYRIKSLGEIDGEDKLKTQSEDGQDWLPWNGSWNAMPKFTSSSEGSLSATIKSKFYEDAGGTASVFIRTRKDSGGDNYDSNAISMTVNPKPSPSPSPSPTPSPTPTPTQTPSPAASPTPKPSPSPTRKPSPSPTLEPADFIEDAKEQEASVLGTTSEPSPRNEAETLNTVKGSLTPGNILSWSLVLSGLIFLGGAGIPLLKRQLSKAKQNQVE